MALKKAELYRGFNIFTEELSAGAWAISAVEIPAEETESVRPPTKGRVPGTHPTKEAAVQAARAHIDRILKNRKNRAGV